MKDNSDIPLPTDQLKYKVLVFAIIDQAAHEYEQITKGYVEISSDEDQKSNTFHYLEVKNEETNQILMRSNLKFHNNFGKQKGSIISWTDIEQPQYQDIALSFQKQKQCEMLWRLLCQKIGKSHLEINGTQILQLPNTSNLYKILQKTKNNVELIEYNIAHEGSLILNLRKIFEQMKGVQDQMGMGVIVRIINNIMSPNYSTGVIQSLLMKENFQFLLEVQQYKKNINFRKVYETNVGQHLRNKFELPEQIFDKVEISHRAVFYRENVLNLMEDSLLESMMVMITREAQLEIMSYLNRAKFMGVLNKIVLYPPINETQNYLQKCLNSSSKDQNAKQKTIENNYSIKKKQAHCIFQCQQKLDGVQKKQNRNLLVKDKIDFIQEALIIYQHISSEQIKATFKQSIYSQGILFFIESQIQNNNQKALQLLFCIIKIDKIKFFNQLVVQFKSDSTNNLLKCLIKKYLNQSELEKSILYIIESFATIFNENIEILDFFMGTFVYSILFFSKQSKKSMKLINSLLQNLENYSTIFLQIIKSKVCDKIASQYRSGSGLKSKIEELQMTKMVKYILIKQAQKSQKRDKQIEKALIQSGFLQCCMIIFFKHSSHHNLIYSSMLENFKILEKVPCSKIHKYLISEYSKNQILIKILQPLKQKYIKFQNQKVDNNDQISNKYRIVHNFMLQNEYQDDYLMNDEIENIKMKQIIKQKQEQEVSNKKSRQKVQQNLNDQSRLIFKRIMNQISSLQDQTLLNSFNKRKLIKKSQNAEFNLIQFNFQLPEINQLQDEEI